MDNSEERSQPDSFVGFSSAKTTASVILATTLVKLSTQEGNSCVVRGVLDSAAQTSCISEHCAQLLRVKRLRSINLLSGLSQASLRTRGITNLNIDSLNGQSLAQSHFVQIVDNISSNLPQTTISKEVRQKVCSLVLADPTFDVPSPVDILIGADLFALAFTGQRLPLGPGQPVAFGTMFGFVLMGSCCVGSPQVSLNEDKVFFTITDMDLHKSIQKFWQIEEPPNPALSPEEIHAERHFATTFQRDPSGKYIVRLPFKKAHPNLGDSAAIAKKRFFSLEGRFSSQPCYKDLYVNFMQDYLDSGHMTPCTYSALNFSHYFIPHHGVLKKHDPTKKLRVVFDASSRTSNNVSLNDILLSGPKLQNSIFDVILHFRRHAIVFSCDITQMFRNIMLHPDDQPFQLIYWRSQPSEPLQPYKLATVTYGMTCSPFLAIRTLQQLAHDERENFPRAAEVLLKQTFVDDIITGSDTLEEALNLKDELTELLRLGGFRCTNGVVTHPVCWSQPIHRITFPILSVPVLPNFMEY
ncbi:uncharacterized protein LOC124159777 [Ischnura elegans]|uniref:uncharacterized protein LOC124159777 n=1 Tax=Ischnura elegans TaxID=197161 RepID=UPI001ED887B4|nr:uncharacterized protein LOC124159777 [Ischnura elegans]